MMNSIIFIHLTKLDSPFKQNTVLGLKSCEYYPYTYNQIIYRWERLTRTVTHYNLNPNIVDIICSSEFE